MYVSTYPSTVSLARTCAAMPSMKSIFAGGARCSVVVVSKRGSPIVM
jgi:hypothetical protein